MFKLKSVELLKTIYTKKDIEVENIKEFPLFGRSNVGKSSLLNMVFNKKIAHISKAPGKTRSINKFLINNEFYLTDLPGYGYAKRSKTEILSWQKVMNYYLEISNITSGVWLMDSRRPLTKTDGSMLELFEKFNMDIFVVLTKIDKLTKNELNKNIFELQKMLKGVDIILTSSSKKIGLDDFWEIIQERII